MDNLSPEDRRKNMQNIRSTNTKMEQRVLRKLWKLGLRYRKNVRSLPGKPDIAIKKYKIVVFLDSCFFHACPHHFIMPKNNRDYWEKKIKRNIERDYEINQYYLNNEWTVMRFWEHETRKELDKVVNHIIEAVQERKNCFIEKK